MTSGLIILFLAFVLLIWVPVGFVVCLLQSAYVVARRKLHGNN